MTVSSATNKAQYTGNGSTYQFSTGFPFISNSDVVVTHTDTSGVETTYVESTHYTLTGAGTGSAGTVTMILAPDYTPAASELITITRGMTFTQTVDYVTGDKFPAETHEQALDKLTMITQELKEVSDRSLTFNVSSQAASFELPDPVADEFLHWNSAASALESSALSELSSGTPATEFSQTVLDDTSASGWMNTLCASPFSSTDSATITGAIGAAPNPNLIINGGMDRWQRGISSTSAASSSFLADRHQLSYTLSSTGQIDLSQDLIVKPTVAQAGIEFLSSLEIKSTVACDITTSDDHVKQIYTVEGYDFSKVSGGQAMTLSFWIYSTIGGTVSVSFRNAALTRSYVTTVEVDAATTWEKKTVTITSDSSGTWLLDERAGCVIAITLSGNVAGNNATATLDSWATVTAGQDFYSTTQDDLLVSNDNVVHLTGLKLEKGSVATGWYPEKIANITEEAKRYYRYLGQGIGANNLLYVGGGVMTSATNARVHLQFPVSMRDVPTLDKSAVDALTVTDGTSTLVSTNITTVAAKDGAVLNVTVATGTFSATDSIAVYLNASDYIGFNAEL